jgi:hypothetical protein
MLFDSLWLVLNERPFAQLMPAHGERPCSCHLASTRDVGAFGVGAQKGRALTWADCGTAE